MELCVSVLLSSLRIFVCLAIKAVHIELVSDLTAEALIAALRRFTARRGYPVLIWSDNGRNFIGAKRELSEMYEFLEQQMKDSTISRFCADKHIEWRYIPEHGPHFGGIWEAAVKSTKYHLKRVIGETRLTFEELTTVLAQVEACLNSRPLTPVNTPDDDSVIVRHFWNRWSTEYLSTLNKYNKWHYPTRNLVVGDIVLMKEDGIVQTKWPLARVVEVFSGSDKIELFVSQE